MLKRLASFIASAAILCGLTGCSLTKTEIVEKTYSTEVPPKMLFLGDSIAAGFGLEGYEFTDNYNCPDSYANLLKTKYTEELSGICTHEMQNFAVSGDTSADLLELLNSGKLDPALESSDAVVVSIGGNDMLHIILSTLSSLGIKAENKTFDFSDVNILSAASSVISMEKDIDNALVGFEANLKEISAVLNERTDGTIYIQTLYDPLEVFTEISMLTDFSAEKIGRFNDIIRENAAGNYQVIDVAPAFTGKCGELTRIKELDIHPNEAGHRIIADKVDEAFRSTGFTVTVEEQGEPKLTLLTIILILLGVAAMLVVVVFVIPKMFRKYE